MTATVLTRLPMMAGGAVASSAGRIGLWAISHFARAPLAYSSVFVLTTLSVMAANNALFNQQHRHPAPLFSGTATAQAMAPVMENVEEVQPAVRQTATRQVQPDYISDPVSPQTTASVSQRASVADVPDGEPIGNSRVFEVQKKLAQLRLFDGKVDGYYGPMTASAIRKFEAAAGLKPQGALTEDVVNMILRAPVNDQMTMLVQGQSQEPAALPQQRPVQQMAANSNVYVAPQQPVAQQQAVPPLVFSQPAQQQVAVRSEQPVLIAQQVKPTAEDVFDEVANGAANAFDTVANTVGEWVNQPGAVRQIPAARNTQTPQPPAQLVTTRQATEQPPTQQRVTAPAVQTASLQAPANATSSTDPQLVSKVQRGLASLGFLAGSVDGVPGEATAKAIRNFEVYYNYDVTGKVTPQLVDMLVAAGAVI